jgi:hypothetical protein
MDSFGSERYDFGHLWKASDLSVKAYITAFQSHPSCDHLDVFFSTTSYLNRREFRTSRRVHYSRDKL